MRERNGFEDGEERTGRHSFETVDLWVSGVSVSLVVW